MKALTGAIWAMLISLTALLVAIAICLLNIENPLLGHLRDVLLLVAGFAALASYSAYVVIWVTVRFRRKRSC